VKRLDPGETAHLISISRLRVHDGTEVSVLRFRGGVAAPTEEDFTRHLAEAGKRSPFLVVDLSEIDAIHSRGMGMLLEQARSQERLGGWLRIVAPSPQVAAILDLSGLARAFVLLESEEAAVRDLGGRAA